MADEWMGRLRIKAQNGNIKKMTKIVRKRIKTLCSKQKDEKQAKNDRSRIP